ncbi:DUF4855 domain-containing protein [Brevibacillus fluminis]|uniref:DUF4855 domain-containing protein n=1 Tax=Brevibacillus fluminis TaxID=511487 RepID=UPI003F8C2A49
MKRGKHLAGKLAALGLCAALLANSAWAAEGTTPVTMNGTPNATSESNVTAPVLFTDLSGSYARKAVEQLAANQFLSGKGDGKFRPNDPISRLDAATLLAKIVGLQPNAQAEPQFEDVPHEGLQGAYVATLAEAGIIKGRSEATFGARDSMTRQELAVVLHRLMELAGEKAPKGTATVAYQDEQEIADYALDAVAAVTSIKWMQGNNGLFSPTRVVSRGEAAVIADRIFAARQAKLAKVDFEVDKSKLTMVAGTSEQIHVTPKDGEKLYFSPIFSFDQAEVGRILSDGTFIAGPKAGKGTITVTVGQKSVTIPVEITPDGTPKEGEAAASTEQKNTLPTDWLAEEGFTNYGPDSFTSIQTTGPVDTFLSDMEKKYPGPVGGLTKPSDAWTGYFRQIGREVTVALPEAKRISHILLTFRQERKSGVELPPGMEVELSQDGKVWWYAGSVTNDFSPSDMTPMNHTMMVSLPEMEASYVRVRFPVKVIVFARNLQIWGSDEPQSTGSAALAPVLLGPAKERTSLEDQKAGDRLQNMLLAYSGGYAERGVWTKDDFLPFVGYISQDGKVLDQMFDSILFLPYPNLQTTQKGWKAYLDDLFLGGRQLDALNEAMREYNERRGTLVNNPTKEKVVLTLPYPAPTQNDFGQVYSDMVPFSFAADKVGDERAYKFRKMALEWYFNDMMKRWKSADFKYLQLEGIYWFHEFVDDGAPHERELIRDASTMVHQNSLRFYWIPYFGAAGLTEWKTLGFDYAFLQPNFYSDKEIPVDRVEGTLAVANQYGMGIEVEGDERMVRDMRFYRTYYNQLIAGHKLGIDKDKVHAYYYGSKSLLEAFRSKSPQARAVYDDTYQWMRGRFQQTDYLMPEVAPVPPADGSATTPGTTTAPGTPSTPGTPPPVAPAAPQNK